MTLGANPEETIIAGTGGIYYAPTGTAFPASADDPIDGDDWTATGLFNEDGLSVKISPQSKEFFSWQSQDATRRKVKRAMKSVTAKMQQFNRANIVLALGGAVEGTTDDWTFWPPADGDATPEWAFIVEVVDGDKVHRFCVFRGSADADVDLVFNDDTMSEIPVTVSFLAPGELEDPDHPGVSWFWQSNDPALDESEGDT